MLSRFLALIIILSLGVFNASAETPFKEGDLLVQFEHGADVSEFARQHSAIGLRMVELLTHRVNVWLCEYDIRRSSPHDALAQVRNTPGVINAQFNHYVTQRSVIPNDPRFNQQWGLYNTGQTGGVPGADISAPDAWEFSTGGFTAQGDQIVIAVIDGGADLQHSDISYFKNVHDIPGNGIDDDNNGYIDDYHGWNAYNNNGNVPSDGHGTHVSGIAAAIGNNALGVAGVNWGAKVMPIAGASGTEAIVVRAYGYVIEMRAKYNETRGDSGAFIVATNSSFGVDFGQPANYPIWSAMYDSMGQQGILSCAATANQNVNVDIVGDMPTACPSEWLVSVTNTTHTDAKNAGAAYGLTTIDLGAPGTNIVSTFPSNGYGSLTGTSMATPMVAGAIGLMFSAASYGLIDAYKNDPADIALLFKEWLLAGVDTIPALQNITVSGGRLNVHNAILKMMEYGDQDDPRPPTNAIAFSDYTTPTSMLLTWTNPTTMFNGDPIEPFVIQILRDSVLVAEVLSPGSSHVDTGLVNGVRYTYNLRAKIINTDSLSTEATASWFAGGSPVPSNPTTLGVSGSIQDGFTIRWMNPSTQEDGTTLHDMGGVRLYRNGSMVATLARTRSDTARADSTVDIPPPGTHTYHVTAIDTDIPANESGPSNTAYTPLALPLHDRFPVPGLPAAELWIATNVTINDRGLNPPSPPCALNLDGSPTGGGDRLESLSMDLAGEQGNGHVLAYYYQPRGIGESPEVGDSLIIELRNSLGEWRLGRRYPGLAAGASTPPFRFDVVRLDSIDAGGGTFFYNGFRFRFRNKASIGVGDDWFVDDIFFGIPNSTPVMVVPTTELADTLMANTVDPTSYGFVVRNSDPLSSPLEFSITAGPPQSWIDFSDSTRHVLGGEEVRVGIRVNFIGAAPGVYETSLIVSGNDTTNLSDTVRVRFLVVPAPTVVVTPDSFSFALAGFDSTAGQIVLRNTGEADLSFTTAVQGAYAHMNLEQAGSAANNTTSNLPLVRGVVIGVSTDVLLDEIRAFLGLTTSQELRFVVYRNTSATGTFTKIFERVIANSGAGTQLYSSGVLGLELQAGMFYAVAVGWNAGAQYYWQSAAPVPITTSFGSIRGGFSQLAYPPGTTVSQNFLANLYLMQFVTARSRWLSVEAGGSGTIQPGDSSVVTFSVKAQGVPYGSSRGSVILNTNDPLAQAVAVPVLLDVLTGVETSFEGVPGTYSLSQNYPNPFNPSTRIKFGLPTESAVSIVVYNVLGQEVASLVREHLPAGFHNAQWDGRNIAGSSLGSGVFFVRIEAASLSGDGRYTSVKKMVLMK